MNRADSGKFLYILNQIDMTAREDNPEDVVAAWQRALGDAGPDRRALLHHLQPGRGQPDRRPGQARRFEAKRDADLAEIHGRMRRGRGRARLPHRRRPGQDRQGHPRARRAHPQRGRGPLAPPHPDHGRRRLWPARGHLRVLEHQRRALEGTVLRARMARDPQDGSLRPTDPRRPPGRRRHRPPTSGSGAWRPSGSCPGCASAPPRNRACRAIWSAAFRANTRQAAFRLRRPVVGWGRGRAAAAGAGPCRTATPMSRP